MPLDSHNRQMLQVHQAHEGEQPNETASGSGERPKQPFLRTRGGIASLVAIGSGAAILAFEYRAYLFGGDDALWILLLACVGMHFLMHRGLGNIGGTNSRDHGAEPRRDRVTQDGGNAK